MIHVGERKIVALYCRISKNIPTNNESDSIVNQKILLQKAAAQYGYEHTQFFIDDGYSGTVFERPALKQMEDAIKAGMVCAVLVKDISRLGRDYLKIGYYLERFFPQHDVRFIAVSGGIDSNTNSTDFVPLYSVMDEWYARDISRKMRLMYQSCASSGVAIGSPVYGYTKSTEKTMPWETDHEAASVVRYIYRLAFLGYGSEQIAKILEADKILTPAHYHLKNGSRRVPTSVDPYHWASTTVAKILCSREYCGDVVNLKTYSTSYKDKKRRENTVENMVILQNVHEAIIDRSFWEYIQHKHNLHKMRKKSGKQSLFSGFLRCGDCGHNLHYHFNQANPSIEYYNCSNYVGNRGTCSNTHYIRLDSLSKRVLDELQKLIKAAQNNGFWERVTAAKSMESQKTVRKLMEQQRKMDKRQNELKKYLATAYEDKVKGVMDDETFVLLSNQFKRERDELKEAQQRIQTEFETAQKFQDGLARFKKEVKGQTNIKFLTRDIVGQFIDWIAVYPEDRSVWPYTQKIEIHYHFIGKIKEIL